MPKAKPPRSYEVTIDRDGSTYRGSYTVQGRVVSVSSAYGSKSTQVGGLDGATVARLLLAELVTEFKRPH